MIRTAVFTGIIEGVGRVERIEASTNRSAMRMTINLGKGARGLKAGQSVALNGVCLTVVRRAGNRCAFELIGETVKKTGLGGLREGEVVNVERSLRAGDRLEGHFVLGHVDGVGIIHKIQEGPREVKVWFKVPAPLSKYVTRKGSIAIDGISLTIVDAKKTLASVCLIPHTIQATSLGTKRAGDKINIETDILGKYILG